MVNTWLYSPASEQRKQSCCLRVRSPPPPGTAAASPNSLSTTAQASFQLGGPTPLVAQVEALLRRRMRHKELEYEVSFVGRPEKDNRYLTRTQLIQMGHEKLVKQVDEKVAAEEAGMLLAKIFQLCIWSRFRKMFNLKGFKKNAFIEMSFEGQRLGGKWGPASFVKKSDFLFSHLF